MTQKVSVGRVVSSHGLRGDVLVRRFGEAQEVLSAGSVLSGCRGLTEFELKVSRAKPHPPGWLVRFEGAEDCEAAEALVGTVLQVDASRLPPLEDGVYYHFELEGAEVVTDSGEVLGRVESVLETGANDVLTVVGPRGEILLPMIDQVIREFDRAERRLVVSPLPGLLPEIA